MDIFDHSGRITVGAIGYVAEQILKYTSAQLGRLLDQGPGCELEPLRSEYHDKMYLVLLSRTTNRRADGQRRMLIVGFFDDTVGTCPTQAPRLDNVAGTSATPKGEDSVGLLVDGAKTPPREVEIEQINTQPDPGHVPVKVGDSSTELLVEGSAAAAIDVGNKEPDNTALSSCNLSIAERKQTRGKRRLQHVTVDSGTSVKRALFTDVVATGSDMLDELDDNFNLPSA